MVCLIDLHQHALNILCLSFGLLYWCEVCIEYMGWAVADISNSVCANSICNYSFLRYAEVFRKRHLHNWAVFSFLMPNTHLF